jgi:hypothetical protein
MCSYEYIYEMHPQNQMVIDFKPVGGPGTRAEFSYHMTPATITITGKGSISVGKDLEAGLAQDRILAASPCHQIQDYGPTGPGRLAWRAMGRQNTNIFPIE